MVDVVKITEEIILTLVSNKDMVKVKQFETEDDNIVLVQVFVDEEDMPKVIGKRGKVINSIRTIVQAASYLHDNKTIKIDIDSI